MRAVLHARLVSAQQRGRHAFRQREVHEFPGAGQGYVHDLDGLCILRIRGVRLQVVLALIRRIAQPSFDEAQLATQGDEPGDFRCVQQVSDFQQHMRSRRRRVRRL